MTLRELMDNISIQGNITVRRYANEEKGFVIKGHRDYDSKIVEQTDRLIWRHVPENWLDCEVIYIFAEPGPNRPELIIEIE